MILTLTMNPSVDISYHLDSLQIDDINRVETVSKTAGGKGLNVARVIRQLGTNVSATGLLGGTLGEFIRQQLKDQDINERFAAICKESRNCIAILHDDGNQTEILESGPTLTFQEGTDFLKHLDALLDEVDLVTISGSLPKGLAEDYYVAVIESCNEHNVKVILDTSGGPLKEVLTSSARPFAVKPNLLELESLLEDKDVSTTKSVVKSLSNDLFKGIECVLVSRGSEGAVIKWKENYYKATIPKVEVVNPVGSGDATVAGLARAVKLGRNRSEAIKEAMTAGVLNALNEKTGAIDKSMYDDIYQKINVEKIY